MKFKLSLCNSKGNVDFGASIMIECSTLPRKGDLIFLNDTQTEELYQAIEKLDKKGPLLKFFEPKYENQDKLCLYTAGLMIVKKVIFSFYDTGLEDIRITVRRYNV